jgi:hypothetical protein
MIVQPGSCRSCGEDVHGDAPCPPRPTPEASTVSSGPCNCLPEPQDDWHTCTVCGVPQVPGKPSCGYCGHRWVQAQQGSLQKQGI